MLWRSVRESLVSVSKILNLGFAEMAALRLEDTHILTKVILQTFKNGYVSACGAFVVAYESTTVIRIGSDDANSLDLVTIKR